MALTLNTLYKSVLKTFLEDMGGIDTCHGICNTAEKALCGEHQSTLNMFRRHFNANKPTNVLRVEFFVHYSYVGCYEGEVFWWSTEHQIDVISDQRRKFLEKMILITDPKNASATLERRMHFLKN